MPTSSSSTRSTPLERPRSTRGRTSSATSAWSKAIGALALGALVACRNAAPDLPDAATSPQASAEPAPLANVPPVASGAGAAVQSVEALRGDRSVDVDTPHEVPPRELGVKELPRDPKDLGAYILQAVVRTGEGPPAPKGPEVSLSAIDAARKKTEARLTITASMSRARFVLSGGFVLPAGTELRARADRYGHLVLWPGEDTYRVAEPGALRALFEERRLDVTPVSGVEIASAGEGARRLNLRTRRVDLVTRAAKAFFELAAFRDAGDGGGLVCRMLLDLMAGQPDGAPCTSDEIPLHAEVQWATQGALVFDVTSIERRNDVLAQDLAAPPSTATFVAGPLPRPGGEAILGKADLAALRTSPLDLSPSTAKDAMAPPVDAGLLLVNGTDLLRVAWIDGVPAAWVGPGSSLPLPSLVRGRYTLQWRSALGDAAEPPQTVVVPGRAEVGVPEPPVR